MRTSAPTSRLDGAPARVEVATPPEPDVEPEPPAEPESALTPRRIAFAVVFIVAAVGGLYFLLPKLAGLHQTWGQLRHGDPAWLGVAAALELLSIGGYALLFATVFGRDVPRIDWRVSLQIPLAGIAAIRLLAAAGAGGVAVSAWALRRAGMASRTIACRMVAGYVLQYAVYLGALIVCGIGLRVGLFSGKSPALLTILPAALAFVVVMLVAAMSLVPGDFERRLRQVGERRGLVGRLAAKLAAAPTTLGAGVRTAIQMVRELQPGLVGALLYWGFDIAVLGFCCRAFGAIVPVAVVVMAYFLGTLGSLLPLPGGIGGVEGGMIGALVAFGVPAGRAVVGVLAYRALSFWLPTLPGVAGYVALRRTVNRWKREDTARKPAARQNV